MAGSSSAAEDTPSYSQFACIGAGFSGIGLGATLQRWYGITDIRIFERDAYCGGTWWANDYPGAACDVPTALYSLSYEPHAGWSQVCPSRDELLEYIVRVAKKYKLIERMSFNTKVERCEWLEESSRWRLTIRNLLSGETSLHECQFLFSGVGALVTPQELDIPGAEHFKGQVFHTARWRHDVDLTDKNVIVIGNGCTGNQVVPAILPKTKHLTHLVRSQHWVLPPISTIWQPLLRFSLKYIPGVMVIQRFFVFYNAEIGWRGVPMTSDGQKARDKVRAISEQYIKSAAPEKYHEMLKPDFEPYCKRRIFDAGYYPCLHADNITLTEDKPIEVVPNGIRTENGLIEADVIVLANGFKTNETWSDIEIIGRDGKTVKEHWAAKEGPGAYNGISLSGFPNFFAILGPNTITGHTSALMASENAINYSLRILKPVLDGKATAVDVQEEAEDRYVSEVQANLQKTVFLRGGTTNWYTKDLGGDKRWNASSYPWWQPNYWYRCLFPVWTDLKYLGTDKRQKRTRSIFSNVPFILGALLVAGLAWELKQGNNPRDVFNTVSQSVRSAIAC